MGSPQFIILPIVTALILQLKRFTKFSEIIFSINFNEVRRNYPKSFYDIS
tara:strand:+ start:4392 stop:4541 length:150 start_codon:yes stop_codon:yes gene_type:complete